ncbi:MAG: hypothetical protein METHP_01614 [Methanoregula sp. SKADARSKE-2]|nr:MAG: hypothetical protein METHP_01614 [Methanoregula sp. SKADARSKE-2]
MEAIFYETPRNFVPDITHVDILRTVAEKPGCSIRHVVSRLLHGHTERIIRNSIHELLLQCYLDGGKPTNELILRLTSKGRILLQQRAG